MCKRFWAISGWHKERYVGKFHYNKLNDFIFNVQSDVTDAQKIAVDYAVEYSAELWMTSAKTGRGNYYKRITLISGIMLQCLFICTYRTECEWSIQQNNHHNFWKFDSKGNQ